MLYGHTMSSPSSQDSDARYVRGNYGYQADYQAISRDFSGLTDHVQASGLESRLASRGRRTEQVEIVKTAHGCGQGFQSRYFSVIRPLEK